ncbi:Sodium bicarbonate transporter-like protein 11 [Porphyridium purpureum]|uniref:Sodium bicarbonate transporter-like protein 11 n=1 Tax=Porphyridium purpureum TaxID=35688 RepID=A0A5J4YPB9_PORPP|nr:Sodium bicarbonate transporter-like protein 11 [Porphyridium purpureum]|eukprot:POR5858..scf249_10
MRGGFPWRRAAAGSDGNGGRNAPGNVEPDEDPQAEQGLQASTGSTPSSSDGALHNPNEPAGVGVATNVMVHLERVPVLSVGEEVRAAKELRRIANVQDGDRSVVLLDVPHVENCAHALDVALHGLVKAGYVDDESSIHEAIKDAVLVSPTADHEQHGHHEDNPTSDDSLPVWRHSIQGRSFVVVHAKVQGLPAPQTCIVRLLHGSTELAFNSHASSPVHFLVLVLGHSGEVKLTKSDAVRAQHFATMLRDETFYADAMEAHDEQAFRSAVGAYVDREEMMEHNAFDQGHKGNDADEFDDMQRTGKLFGGLRNDIRRKYRWSVYKSDWTDGLNDWRSIVKYISTIAWLYFAVIMPVIAFGSVNDANTNQAIGVSETVLSQAISGGMAALFAGQPLAISMTTGPVTVFIQVLFNWSEALDIDFLPFYAWTGIWCGIILTAVVAFDLIAYVRYVGQFTEEIFAGLVAVIFISEFLTPLIIAAQDDPTDVFLLSLVLSLGIFFMARILSQAERSYLLNKTTRTLLADFGMPASVLLWSGLRQIFTNVDVEMLPVPEKSGILTTSGRPWLVDLGNISAGYVFLAFVPGLLLALLFFVDQNVAVLLTCKRENKLKKGTGYFLDMQVIAIAVVICSILGVPWANAAVPHSHLHARMLAETEEYELHGRAYTRVIRARETRVTNTVAHLLIFASMFLLFIVGYIPSSVVWGFFLYIGVATIDGNQLFERLLLVFTQPSKFPSAHYIRRVPLKRVFLYTAIQLVLLIFLWFVNQNFYISGTPVFNAGLLFPLIIISFIPIRKFMLPKFFTRRELHALEMEHE